MRSDNLYAIQLKCGTSLSLDTLEARGISYVLCARLPNDKGELEDKPYLAFSGLWGHRSQITLSSYGKRANAWNMARWQKKEFPGVQLMTGKPTFRTDPNSPDGFVYLTDLDIEHRLIEKYPAVFEKILWVYREACEGTPCEIETKSGGRRLSAYVPMLDSRRFFRDSDGSEKMLFEIFSENGLSRLDSRYAMISGSVLDLPRVPREALQEIHGIISEVGVENESTKSSVVIPATDENLPEGLTWKQGKNFLISTDRYDCSQSHASNPTCEYRKYDDGAVDKWCWACDTGWRIVEGESRSRVKEAVDTPQNRKHTYLDGIEPITALPHDHHIIASAPTVEVREQPSFRHFSKEERVIVRDVLQMNPDAGWHGRIPVFTTRYEYLHPLTNKFALNGQPNEVEKRRVWSTIFGNCEICGAVTAEWVDRYLLTAGRYCDGCHKDYPLGSYLEWELDRKLPNSIISKYQGFIGDDPEFQDFRLWEPCMLTHLGAGMATGKSTEIYKAMIMLAMQGLGKGIIAVPRISLARFLAHLLRRRDGHRAWGLWHEGSGTSEQFIGEYGAIVCLPSLPRAVQCAEENGVTQLHIAIDELDFSYGLLSLSVEQATTVKQCLQDALDETGLVVSGQTESTLALEALAEEIKAELVQGFYNIAKPADGAVVMHKHANVEGKSMSIVCGAIDDISQLLDEGYNVYVFCSTRRDGDLIADEFQQYTPVVYNAYTKGNARADAVLRNQRLTDSCLFIGTSAAGVGISILDPKARTVIVSGLNFGTRDASMVVQEGVRDRGRCGVSLHYADYNLSLPVRPTENEIVSLYHEAVKQAASESAHLSSAGIRKIAYAQALNSLADMQIETFVENHLGKIGNMPVYQASALPHDTERIEAVSERRSEIRNEEKEKRITTAIELLKEPEILTSSEIRVLSNKGGLSPDDRLAHETANAAARAVGWDDKIHGYEDGEPIKEMPDPEDFEVAIPLVMENINFDKLTKQRRGYLAVHYPKWTADKLQLEIDRSNLEITAINDDRFLGQLLMALLDRLTGNVFNSASLATAVREVLNSTAENGKSFLSEITAGARGASAYRKARFLHCADDDRVVDWVRGFISEWYPARIAQNDDDYALCHAEHLDLRLAAFSRWLLKQPGVPDGTQLDLSVIEATELPDHDANLKNNARFRREAGEAIKDIAETLGRHPSTISKWCEGIEPPSPAQSEILGILADGAVWKRSDIEVHTRVARRNVTSALNSLLEAGKICKPKRGYYEKV